MPGLKIFRWLGISSLLAYRVVSWALLITSFIFALIVCAARFWVLPNIEGFREPIAQRLSTATGQRVTIGKLEGRWSGVNLQLTLNDFVLFDQAGQPALKLAEVNSVLSWWSLVYWEPRFDLISVDGPDLEIRRDTHGVISVAGIAMGKSVDGGGLSDWLLRQDEITIQGATIKWQDDLRQASLLALSHVDFRLENFGSRHRFGLRAVPPEKLASPLDVRGDLTGRAADALEHWKGQLFVQLDYTDIAAWREWVEFPLQLPHGVGAVRLWTTLQKGGPVEITADVQLAQVRTRLAAEARELQLDELKGRVSWKQLADGFEVKTAKLGMSANALVLQPMDLLLRYHAGVRNKPASGELQLNAVDLEPLAAFADNLPLPPPLLREFDQYKPRGSLYDMTLRWSGEWPQPGQYTVKSRFVNFGLNAVGRLPGLQNVSGQIDCNEKGGTLALNTQNATVELPRLFAQKLSFDMLNAQAGWQLNGAQYEVKLNTVAFSNPGVTGTLSGSYQAGAEGRGMVDIAAGLSRVDARSVLPYLPLQMPLEPRQWLETALLGGTSRDVKIRLRGNPNDFPFPEGRGGLFEVTARVNGGVLEFANNWPRIENIDADLTFRGRRMDIVAREGSILGAKLARVRVEIADLTGAARLLTVNGEAEGPTAEFVNFIEKSPVSAMIDRVTSGLRAEGAGRLALRLSIPLANPRDTRVAGTYQFLNNALESTEALFPNLEQVNARLEFTDSSLRVSNGTLNLLGGPASINVATLRDGTRINIAGRVNMDNFRRSTNVFAAQALSGATDWKATVLLRKQFADMVIESSLQGVTSSLPVPFAKAPAEIVPVRFERIAVNAQQDRLLLSVGNVVAAQLQRRRDGGRSVFERGVVNFGGGAADAERRGVWITGALKQLDLDQWLALFKASPAGNTQLDVAGVDLKVASLNLMGRRFSDLAVNGASQGGNWQASVAGREMLGDISWRPQGRGRVVARMKNLVIPPAAAGGRGPADKDPPTDMPALDVVAEQFQLGTSSLGRLELNAVPEGRDWRIERLRVSNPDATIQAEGLWQSWFSQPRTMVNVKLDVTDIGKFLVRMGYPEGVRRGSAKLEGPLAWAGNPAEVDYPSLSGNFVIEANKGQFLKLDPGVGKLLGILSLQSLPRRLSLDFRDIFSEGLAFDEIVGAVKVNRGVATTENLRIQGPAVRILMSGDVDLNAETQKLRVKVFPSVSDSLSVAGALVAGPIAGIAAYVAQKLLRDPINQMAAYEYSVTGTWSDPQMSKLDSGQSAELDKSEKAGKAR